jgi:DnaK suppressor protein
MDDDRARKRLQEERERIEGQLAKLRTGPAEDDQSGDPGDDATDLHDREVDAGLAEGLRSDLAAIERAEERLAKGTYGISIESGDPIPDGRLEAIPWAERTAEEQDRYERGR